MESHARNSAVAGLLLQGGKLLREDDGASLRTGTSNRSEHLRRHLSRSAKTVAAAEPEEKHAVERKIVGVAQLQAEEHVRRYSSGGADFSTVAMQTPTAGATAELSTPSTPWPIVLQSEQASNPTAAESASLLNSLMVDLRVDRDLGLTVAEAAHRVTMYGVNKLDADETVPIWKLFLSQFMNIIIILLLAACIASFALQEIAEGVAVLIIVLINASIATYTEHSSGNALAQLSALSQPFATVIRDGNEMQLDTAHLVPGDIVLLKTGDIVPADGRIIDAVDLKADEMILTGESVDVAKTAFSTQVGPAYVPMHSITSITDKEAITAPVSTAVGPSATSANAHAKSIDNKGSEQSLTAPGELYSSTTITSGHGKFVVTRIGMSTMVGSIAAQLKGSKGEVNCLGMETPHLTPLQVKLHRLGVIISGIAITSALAVFGIGVARNYRDPSNPEQSTYLTMVLVAVSLAVAAAPEGLPLVQTITLAVGTYEMAKEHALIRHLPAVEILGSIQVVCSDKTGTLTEGKMTALKMWGLTSGKDFGSRPHPRPIDITGKGLVPIGEFMEHGKIITDPDAGILDPWVRTTLLSALLNCTANLKIQTDPKDKTKTRNLTLEDTVRFEENAVGQQFRVEGNSSEAPLIVAAAKAGLFNVQLEPLYPTIGSMAFGRPGPEVPFSSSRKMMISVISITDCHFGECQLPPNTNFVVLVKGAPNYVAQQCAGFVDSTGALSLFDGNVAEERKAILEAVDELSMQALRVLAVAIKPLEQLPYEINDVSLSADKKFSLLNSNLYFSGLIASMDPEREGVNEAIAAARTAGISVRMITGDYLKTAVAIAKNIDLITIRDDAEEVAADCEVLRPYGTEYLPNPDIDEITSRVVVFARAKPEDKLVIVKSLQRQGYVTAMTGDGVNDAPALNEADIGIGMGSGTEVAKGAADMVLLDDDFSTIIVSVRRGRIIYNNIQKFIVYLIGTNLSEIFTILIGIAIGLPAVFEAMPILMLNLLCDGSVAMTMSVEPGDADIMDRPPRSPRSPILGGRQWTILIVHALVLAGCVLGSFALGLFWEIGVVLLSDLQPDGKQISLDPLTCSIFSPGGSRTVVTNTTCTAHGIEVAHGMAFVTIAFCEIFRGFTARSHRPFFYGMFSNRSMLRAMAFSVTLSVCVLLIPGLRDVFGFAWMQWYHWLTALAFAIPPLIADEMLKSCLRCLDRVKGAYRKLSQSFGAIESELRQVRHHLITLEERLHLRENKPAHARPEAVESARLLARAVHHLETGISARISGEVWQQMHGAAGKPHVAVRRSIFPPSQRGVGRARGNSTELLRLNLRRGCSSHDFAEPVQVLTPHELRALQTKILKASVVRLPLEKAHCSPGNGDAGEFTSARSEPDVAAELATGETPIVVQSPTMASDDIEINIQRSYSAHPVMSQSSESEGLNNNKMTTHAKARGASRASGNLRREWVDLSKTDSPDKK